MALSNKQKAFINEYLQCYNATEAALRAGYSPTSAHSIGSENLKKQEIASAISQRFQESAMSADEVLQRLGEQARGAHTQHIATKPQLDMVAMAKDGLGNLIPDAIDDDGNIDIVALAKNGTLEQYAPYILQPGYVDLAALKDAGLMHLVKGVKPTQYGMQIEFYDAHAALVDIGRYHALFTDKTESANTGEVAFRVIYD